jgi:4-diphosphocytidyl-2-C-methyl-D-erythritol kinase
MVTFPNAKINLGLNVVERRLDGYHNIETLFYPVALSDILEVIPADEFFFGNSELRIDTEPENNLVVKAYNLLKPKYDLPPVKIHLHKVIPFGAGLGGGSSDAAFMLKMLNQIFEIGLSASQLREFASELGADCPFFIENQPAFATGTGNQLITIDIDLNSYQFVLVKPPFGVNTSHAYKSIIPHRQRISIKDIATGPIETWKDNLKNDFEKPVFEMFPEIETIKQKLYDLGAIYASMSGSGSAVYAFFSDNSIDIASYFSNDYFVYMR